MRRRKSRRPWRTHRPSLYYRISARNWFWRPWRGPVYYRGSRWRRDLCDVLSQLAAAVETQASFPESMEAAGREQRRLQWPFRLRNLVILTIQALAAFCLCVLLFEFAGFSSGEPKILVGLYLRIQEVPGWFGATPNWPQPGEADPAVLLVLNAVSLLVCFFVAFYIAYHRNLLEAVFLKLSDDLHAGRTLSESMLRLRRFFPKYQADLVQAGERSGQLKATLIQLRQDTADAIEQQGLLQRHVFYLVLVLFLELALMVYLTRSISSLPDNRSMISRPDVIDINNPAASISYNSEIEAPQRLIKFSAFFEYFQIKGFPYDAKGVSLLALLCFGLYAIQRRRRRRPLFARPVTGGLLLGLPLIGPYIREQNLARSSMILGRLLSAGVPLPDALSTAAEANLHFGYRRAFRRLARRISMGEALGQALTAGRQFPHRYCTLIRMGERSGQLGSTFAQLAERHRMQSQRRAALLQDLVLPSGLLLLGGAALLLTTGILQWHILYVDSWLATLY